MLKFSEQTINPSLAILLQEIFSLPKPSHTKRPQKQKAKAQSKRQKPPKQKQKVPLPPSGGFLYSVVNRVVEQWFLGRRVTL
jgi:hypothetical protein